MIQRLETWLVVLLLSISVGGHWAVLQSVAWMGMVVTYANDAPMSEAINKTFDGRHPCKLCQAVDEAKKAERKQPVRKVETKLDLFLEASALWQCSPPRCFGEIPSTRMRSQFQLSPAAPPPRVG